MKEREVLLSIRNEIVKEIENIRQRLEAGNLPDKRRKDLNDYVTELAKILRRLKTEEYSSIVIRQQFEDVKKEFRI